VRGGGSCIKIDDLIPPTADDEDLSFGIRLASCDQTRDENH
jgi:hypothetical protein